MTRTGGEAFSRSPAGPLQARKESTAHPRPGPNLVADHLSAPARSSESKRVEGARSLRAAAPAHPSKRAKPASPQGVTAGAGASVVN
jgi:hypothetical protein